MSCNAVSYIVVCFNSEKYISKCLDSILHQFQKYHEIIIIDNNSVDDTLLIAQKLCRGNEKIRLISNKINEGFANAIIKGVAKASGEYVAILNADVFLDPNWCSFLLKSFSDDDQVMSASGNVLFPNGLLQSAGGMMDKYGAVIQRDSERFKSLNLEKDVPVFYNDGSSFIIRKKILDKINFDPKLFLYYEDVDLSWKIHMLGYKICHVPDAISYHDMSHSFHDVNLNKFYYMAKNRLYLCQKNYSLPTQICRVPLVILLILIDAIVYDISKSPKGYIVQFFKALSWNINNLKNIAKEHKKLNSIRILTDKQIDANFIPGSIEFSVFTMRLG